MCLERAQLWGRRPRKDPGQLWITNRHASLPKEWGQLGVQDLGGPWLVMKVCGPLRSWENDVLLCVCVCVCVCVRVRACARVYVYQPRLPNYLFQGSTVPYSEIRSSCCIKPPFFYEMIGHIDGSC